MQRIHSYDEAQNNGAFVIRGLISNALWTPEEISTVVSQHRLFLEKIPAGRLWFICSEKRNQLFFQIDKARREMLMPTGLTLADCVSELQYTEAQKEKKQEEKAVLEQLGFVHSNTAILMSLNNLSSMRILPSQCSYRNATIQDLDVIRRMHDSCFDRLTDSVPDNVQLTEEINNGHVIVCEKSNTIAGSVMVQKKKKRVWIRHVAVSETFRNQGVAKGILNYIIDSLVDGEHCMLWVKENNTAAVNLYRRFGFVQENRKMEIWEKGRE